MTTYTIETLRFDLETGRPVRLNWLPHYAPNLNAAKMYAKELIGTAVWDKEAEGLRIREGYNGPELWAWRPGENDA